MGWGKARGSENWLTDWRNASVRGLSASTFTPLEPSCHALRKPRLCFWREGLQGKPWSMRHLVEEETVQRPQWSLLYQVEWKNPARSVQSRSHVRLFATPWTATRQASLSITNSQSLLKLLSIESVMPPNHLTFCRPLLLLPSIFPSIKVFSNESVFLLREDLFWEFKSISSSVHTMGLDKYVMTCIHHYSITHSSFTALKVLFAPQKMLFNVQSLKQKYIIHLEMQYF